MRVFVEGIGLCAPGLADWASAAEVLSGGMAYVPAPAVVPTPLLLPPNERRRAAPAIRLALAVGTAAATDSGHDPATMPAVFASSSPDGATVHAILEVLASDSRDVSPTRFHNSVHNAASGYWSIATGSREPMAAIGAYDHSYAAGLVEAAVLASSRQGPALLVAYDLPYPAPLHAARPIGSTFGVGFVLTGAERSTCPCLDIRLRDVPGGDSTMALPELEALRLGNPAARSLPLLAALAGSRDATVTLCYSPGLALVIAVTPGMPA